MVDSLNRCVSTAVGLLFLLCLLGMIDHPNNPVSPLFKLVYDIAAPYLR